MMYLYLFHKVNVHSDPVNNIFRYFVSTMVIVTTMYVSFGSCGYAVSMIWTASSEFGTYSLCEQRRFRRACASAQSRQNLRCLLIQAVSQEELSDRKPDPWPL